MDITSYLNSLEDCREALIRFRRDLHRHPEPGWKEFYTTARLIAALKDHGIPAKYGKEILHRDYLWGYPPQKELDVCMERAVSQGADAGIIKEMDGFTGAMAVIETGNPGPVTALRFDIDCNDVGEDMAYRLSGLPWSRQAQRGDHLRRHRTKCGCRPGGPPAGDPGRDHGDRTHRLWPGHEQLKGRG